MKMMRTLGFEEMVNIDGGDGHTCYGVLVRLGDFSACIGYLN